MIFLSKGIRLTSDLLVINVWKRSHSANLSEDFVRQHSSRARGWLNSDFSETAYIFYESYSKICRTSENTNIAQPQSAGEPVAPRAGCCSVGCSSHFDEWQITVTLANTHTKNKHFTLEAYRWRVITIDRWNKKYSLPVSYAHHHDVRLITSHIERLIQIPI